MGMTYDANGNLIGDGTNSYVWDRANRLLSVGSSSYAYDGMNNRVQQTVGGTATKYLLDLQPGLTQVLAATTGGSTDRYVHGLRGIHAMKNNAGSWIWPTQDGLGNVRQEVSDGMVVNGARGYEPYLTSFDEQGSFGMPFGATGEMVDVTGQVYLRSRYYNPNFGLFSSLDPFEGTLERLMSLNRYSWVENNPANMIDPTGLQAVETLCGLAVLSPFDLFFGDLLCLAIGGVALIGAIRAGQAAAQLNTGGTASIAPVTNQNTNAGGAKPPSQDEILALIDATNNINDIYTARDAQRELAKLCNSGLCGKSLRSIRQLVSAGTIPLEGADARTDTTEKEKEEERCSGPTLYHYTDDIGLTGILATMTILPSLDPNNARLGKGQYFTEIAPEQIKGKARSDFASSPKLGSDPNVYSLSQVSGFLFRQPASFPRMQHFVEICIDGLPIIVVDITRHIYLNRSEQLLDIKDRFVRSGNTPFWSTN